jgi:hypothetical protein
MTSARWGELIRNGAQEEAIRAYARSLTSASLSESERRLADETEACIESMYLMAAADGQVEKQELLQLSTSVREMLEAFGQSNDAELGLPLLKLNERLEAFASRLAEQGFERRLQDVAQRLGSPETRCLAFCLAAAVAFVDDQVALGEASAIDAFSEAFGLDADESQYLLREVVERLGS